MTRLVIHDGEVISPFSQRFTDIWVEGNKITGFGQAAVRDADFAIDARDCYVTPGLFDLQVNGGPNCNLWTDPSVQEVKNLRLLLAKCGVTAFLPTLITDELKHLRKNIDLLASLGAGAKIGTESGAAALARMPGIHLEGPFLSPEKPGVHPKQYILPLELETLSKIVTPQVSLMTLAPEWPQSGACIEYLHRRGVMTALGHSNAGYDQANQAFASGVNLLTHTFNALPVLHQRAPGAIAAALLAPDIYCCVICDGLHVDPAMVKVLYRIKAKAKTILVSDAAYLGTSQGDLVGSSITLDQAVRNVVKWGVCDFASAIYMASLNPACVMGLDSQIGNLSQDKMADIVLWDKNNLKIKTVIIDGKVADLTN